MEKKKSEFWSDFKKFITKGNIIDMAVGVVIGGSFGKIVTGLVNYIINPFIGIFMKNGSLNTIKTVITPAVIDAAGAETEAEVAILWGTWIQTIIDFLITALCIFIIIRIIMNTKKKLEAKKLAEDEAKAAEDAAKAKAEADALAEKQKALEESIMNQEKLLSDICTILKNK